MANRRQDKYRHFSRFYKLNGGVRLGEIFCWFGGNAGESPRR
jgi:hypothetical protein